MDALLAAFWGFVGGAPLLLGALVGLYAGASQRVISVVMAVGAGVLISSVAFELMEEAYRKGGFDSPALGLLLGALLYFLLRLGDRVRHAARHGRIDWILLKDDRPRLRTEAHAILRDRDAQTGIYPSNPSEGAPATEALAAFKSSGLPLALVVDERGGIEGLVTPSDVFEALVGDLDDHDRAVRRDDLDRVVGDGAAIWE